jgi:hypothetical protein
MFFTHLGRVVAILVLIGVTLNMRYYVDWRRPSDAFWHLLIVPGGGPLLLLLVAWIIAGFRKSPLEAKQDQPLVHSKTNPASSPEAKEPYSLWDALQKLPAFQEQKELFEALAHLSEDGVDADELPNGRGEFGLTPSNPVPCKTVYGSTMYLGLLRALDGSKIVYNRLGSVGSDVSPHPVDVYEISRLNGQKLTMIFISPYQKRISGKAPRGFTLPKISRGQ